MNGTKLLVFLVLAHSLLYFGQAQFILPDQSSNPNKAFVQDLTGEDLQGSVAGVNESGTVDQDFSVADQSAGFLSVITGILFSPYSVLGAVEAPFMLEFIFKTVIGVVEIGVLAGYIRGVAF